MIVCSNTMIDMSANIGWNDFSRYLADSGRCTVIIIILPESAKYRLKSLLPMLADLMIMVLEQTITDDKIMARIGQISAKTIRADVGRADHHGLCSETLIVKL